MTINLSWYQVNPDYFCELVKQKNLSNSNLQASFFIQLTQCLGYIKDLGFDGIWLMPIYMRGEKTKKAMAALMQSRNTKSIQNMEAKKN
jgi:hypothetical protein